MPLFPSHLSSLLTGHRAPRLWRVLFTALLITVLVLALMPAVPRMPSLGWDKLNHAAAFAALAFAARFAFPSLPRANLWLSLALLSLGGAIELVQALVPSRMADGIDLVADGLGIGVGLLVAALLLRRIRPAPASWAAT